MQDSVLVAQGPGLPCELLSPLAPTAALGILDELTAPVSWGVGGGGGEVGDRLLVFAQ